MSGEGNKPDVVPLEEKQEVAEPPPPARGKWGNKVEFFLAVIGFSIGVGNVFRFPYICFKNGGGAFLIPYSIALACCGMPLMFLELAWGQYVSEGPITAWVVCPLFTGIGICACTMTTIVILYYNVIMCYSVYYMFASINTVVPWAHCRDDWVQLDNCSEKYMDHTIETPANMTSMGTPPSTIYLIKEVLDLSSGLWDFGDIQWRLALCLAFIWIVTFLCVVKGIKSTGKVVYFTATFPYLILVVLFVRGVTLEGAMIGIGHYLSPDWSKLLDLTVWGDAFQQVFYSLGPGWGGLLTFASFNDFHHNIQRDALLVTIISGFTSFFGGFVVFSILGFLSFSYNKPFEQVVGTGITVAFEAYPAALAKMPLAPLWSFCFFFMVIILGLDSEFGMVEALICAVVDYYPKQLRRYKSYITAAVCFGFFFVGLVFVTQGGIFLVNLIDSYFAIFGLLCVCFTECVVFGYVYGIRRFEADIAHMLGYPPSPFFKVMWCAVTPLLIVFILVSLFIRDSGGDMYYQGRKYPGYATLLGLSVGFAVAMIIPVYSVLKLAANGCDWRRLTQPTDQWRPKLHDHTQAPDLNGVSSNGKLEPDRISSNA